MAATGRAHIISMTIALRSSALGEVKQSVRSSNGPTQHLQKVTHRVNVKYNNNASGL